jgi:hypothetical protein
MASIPALGEFFQHGYVTRDLATAKAVFSEHQGVREFLEFDTRSFAPPGATGPFLKVALGYSRGVMVELIQPEASNPGIYGEALRDDRHANLHHLGFFIDQPSFDALEELYSRKNVPVPLVNRNSGMCLLYADTRSDCGLFTEMVVMTEAMRRLFDGIPK